MATAGEKAKGIVYQEVGSKRIVGEIAGNNRYILVTEDIVYVGSVGISSGSWFGNKVKRYPIDSISSVDVRTALLTVELEIVMAGAFETGSTLQSFTSRSQNENITMFAKGQYQQVQHIANMILDIQQWRRNQHHQVVQVVEPPISASIPEQIRQLALLKDQGIISIEEFELKKKEMLSRM